MLLTLNFLFLFTPLNSLPIFNTCITRLILSPSGCLPILSHSISLKLNFLLLIFLHNSLKYLIPLFSCLLMPSLDKLTLHEFLTLFLILHSLCLIIFPHFLELVSYEFMPLEDRKHWIDYQ